MLSRFYRLPLFLMLILTLLLLAPSCRADQNSPSFEQVEIKNFKPKNGIFDVSVEYAPDGTGWLAYSRVDIPKYVETHIAKSTNSGRSWRYVGRINKSQETTIKIDEKEEGGVWREETPSLLYDPTDAPDRRWKIFTNRYFTKDPYEPEDRLMGRGIITMRTAPSADGEWSRGECAVGPYANCAVNITAAHPDLDNVKINTEPGTITHNGIIYMTLDAGTQESGLGDWKNYRVILLSSADHGETWKYVGTLLSHQDAMQFGYLVFTGTSLVLADQKLYVLATPSGGTDKDNQDHDGVMVIEITDIDRAQIRRDKGGKPVVIRHIKPERGSGGLADYHEGNRAGGILFSQASFWGIPEIFRGYKTGVHVP